MIKKITSLLFCMVIVFSMVLMLPLFADEVADFALTASKKSATVGETVTFELSAGAVSNIKEAEITISIPDELDFVKGSVKRTLSGVSTDTDHYENGLTIYLTFGEEGFDAAASQKWLTFDCTVTSDEASEAVITIAEISLTDTDGNAIAAAKGGSVTLSLACEHDGETEIRNAVEPTCSEEGYSGDEYCKKCGEKLADGESIPVSDHVDDDDSWESDADKHFHTCKFCGEVFDEADHAGGKASCSDKAVCDVCEREYGELDPSTHKSTELTGKIDATCTEEGYSGDLICSDCGELIEKGKLVSRLIHELEARGAKEANCLQAGFTGDYFCKNCNQLIEGGKIIPKTDHNTELRDVVKATCKERGYTGNIVCVDCGSVIVQGSETELGDHDTELVNEKEATCEADGYSGDFVCKDCDKVVEAGRVIPAGNHRERLINDVPATCVNSGYSGDKVCRDCGEILEKGSEIAALGHNEQIVDNKEATCLAEGYSGDKVCSRCEQVIQKGNKLPKSDHRTELRNVTEADCRTAGYSGDLVCKDCGETITKGNELPMKDHDTELRGVKESSCNATGHTGDLVCKVCGQVIVAGEEIAALEHVPELVGVVDATKDKEGYSGDKVCKNCGEVIEQGRVLNKLKDYNTTGNGSLEKSIVMVIVAIVVVLIAIAAVVVRFLRTREYAGYESSDYYSDDQDDASDDSDAEIELTDDAPIVIEENTDEIGENPEE